MISFLITELNPGGAEHCLFAVARHMKRQGHQVQVIGLYGDGAVAAALREAGVQVHIIGMRHLFDIWKAFRLYRLLKKSRPHILQTFLFHANIIGRVIGWMARVPVIFGSIRVAEKERFYHPLIEFLTARLCRSIICVSPAVKTFMMKWCVPGNRMQVIPNGVDTDRFVPSAENSSDKPVLLTVARLTRQKGISSALKALSRLDRSDQFIYRIVGDGPDEDRLRSLVKSLGLSASVEFSGVVAHKDMVSTMQSADIFLLPSLWEGMPNAVLEAMACGLPVIVSDVEGCWEMVDDGQNGRIVPAGEIVPLREAITDLLKDETLRKKMGKYAREKAETFSVEQMVGAYERVYKEVCNGQCAVGS